MTTITFKEDIKINSDKSAISILDFFDILRENEIIPELKELSENEITSKIRKAYKESKQKS